MKTRRFLTCLLALMLLLSIFSAQSFAATRDPYFDPDTQTIVFPDNTSAHDHFYAEWITVEEGTCTERGLRYRICQICGEEDYDTPYAPHNFGDWETVEAGSDRSAELRQRTCAVCGYVETESILPRGTLLPGDTGSEVEHLQRDLWAIGYYPHRVTGQYDENTAQAVADFQEALGLEPDGVAWPETLQHLDHDFGPWVIAVMPTRSSVGRIERTCRDCGYVEAQDYGAFLFPGDWGDTVQAVQEALDRLGYPVEINSSYDGPTKQAVAACEEDNGLAVDGIVQPDLWPILFPPTDENKLEGTESVLSNSSGAPGKIDLKSLTPPPLDFAHNAHLEIVITSESENADHYSLSETVSYYYRLVNDGTLDIIDVQGYPITYHNLKYLRDHGAWYEGLHLSQSSEMFVSSSDIPAKSSSTWPLRSHTVHSADMTTGEFYICAVAFVTYEDGEVVTCPAEVSVKIGEEPPLVADAELYFELLSQPKNGAYFTQGETVSYRLVLRNASPVDIWARVYPMNKSNFELIGEYMEGFFFKDPAWDCYTGDVPAGMARIGWENSFVVSENPEALYFVTDAAAATIDFEKGFESGYEKSMTASISIPIGPKVAAAELGIKAQNQPQNNLYFWADATVGFELTLENTGDYDMESASLTLTFPDGSTKSLDYANGVPMLSTRLVGQDAYMFSAADAEAGDIEIKAEGTCLFRDASGAAIQVPVAATLPLKTGVKPEASLSVTVTNTPANGLFFEPGETVEYAIVISNTAGKEPIKKGVLRVISSDGLTETLEGVPEIAPHSSSAPIPYSRSVYEELAVQNPTLTLTAEAEPEFEDLTRLTVSDSVSAELGIARMDISMQTITSPNADGFYCRDDEIVYEITVTNTGSVTIPNVEVYSEDPAGATLLGVISNFAAAGTETFTHSYFVSGPDVAAGVVLCNAVAHGNIGVELVLEVSDGCRDFTGMYPADVSITKVVTGNPQNGYFYQAGETITYEITVTNNGQEALPQATIHDQDPAGAVILDKLIGFAPGASFTYTHSHTVTAAEAEAGGVIVNTAFADYVLPDDSTGTVSATVDSPVGVEDDHCVRLELLPDGDAEMQYRIDRCERHLSLKLECDALLEAAVDDAGRAEALQQIVSRWTDAVNAEYDAIIRSTTDEQMQARIEAEREAFFAWIGEKTAALTEATPVDSGEILTAVAELLSEHCADLCEIHHTAAASELFDRILIAGAYLDGYQPML